MLVAIAKAAAGMVTGILSFASIYNMYEMQSIVAGQRNEHISCSSLLTRVNEWKSINEVTINLKKMSRRELIELYLECDPPGEEFHLTDSAWVCDGYLLGNGPILVSDFFIVFCITLPRLLLFLFSSHNTDNIS